MHCLASWRLFEENLSLCTDVLGIEFLRLLIAQLQQSLGALLLLLLVNHIRNLQGSRARTLRIREDVKLGNRQTLQELIAFFKTLRSFAAAAHHHIDTDKRIRHFLLDKIHLVGKERLVVTAVHQLEHLIASALQRNVEMRHKGTALGTILYEIIITEIRLQTRDAVTLDSFYLIHRLDKVDESLMGSLTEITDIHTGNDDFLTAFSSRLLTLSHKRLDARVARIASGKWNGAIGAIIIAAVLHLQEITGTVATRARRLEGLDFLRLHAIMLMKSRSIAVLRGYRIAVLRTFCIDILRSLSSQSVFLGKFLRPCIAEILNQVRLLVSTQHEVYTLYLADILRFELRITARHDNECARIVSHHPVDSLTAFMIGNFCYRAGVNQTNISFLPLFSSNDAHIFEHFAKSGSFREVEFAA